MLDTTAHSLLPVLGPSMQLGIVVKDFEEGLKFWTEKMRVGPFVTFEESLGERVFYHRGQLSDVKMKVAIAYRGDIQIEIIHQLNSAPSAYKEFTDAGREGLHHLCFFPENLPEAVKAVESMGFVEVSSIRMPDGEKNAIYYEGVAQFGAQIELAPLTVARTTYFNGLKALARNWDGSRPVRRFKNRAEFMSSPECVAA